VPGQDLELADRAREVEFEALRYPVEGGGSQVDGAGGQDSLRGSREAFGRGRVQHESNLGAVDSLERLPSREHPGRGGEQGQGESHRAAGLGRPVDRRPGRPAGCRFGALGGQRLGGCWLSR